MTILHYNHRRFDGGDEKELIRYIETNYGQSPISYSVNTSGSAEFSVNCYGHQDPPSKNIFLLLIQAFVLLVWYRLIKPRRKQR